MPGAEFPSLIDGGINCDGGIGVVRLSGEPGDAWRVAQNWLSRALRRLALWARGTKQVSWCLAARFPGGVSL